MNGNNSSNHHHPSMSNSSNSYNPYNNNAYESDRRGNSSNYSRHLDSNQWTGNHEGAIASSSSSSWKTIHSEMGSRMSSSPEVSRDEDGDAKKKRRIQQACKACSLRRVKCNGEKPCQTCLKNNDECTYGMPKKRGPAKGTTRGIRRDHQTFATSSTSTTGTNTTTTPQEQEEVTAYPRPHSPTSFNSATSLLALQNPHGQPAYGQSGIHRGNSSSSAYDRGRGPSLSSSSSSHPVNERHTMRPPLSSPSDRPWSHHSALPPPSRSVYRGSTSGWDAALPSNQRPRFKEDQMVSSSRPGQALSRSEMGSGSSYPSPSKRGSGGNENIPQYQQLHRPDHRTSSQYPSAHKSSLGNTAPLLQGGGGSSSSSAPSANPSFHQTHYKIDDGEEEAGLRREKEGSPVDELEVAEAALEAIFYEVHQQRHDPDLVSNRLHQNSKSNKQEITLQYPIISEEIKSQLFHIFWSGIALHWPLFYRKSYNDEVAARKRIEEDYPLLFNAICSISALVGSESQRKEADSGYHQEGYLSHRQISTVFYARARYYNIRASQNPCLESAAALILLSLRESGAGHSTEASQYCWSACRMALDLGLHRHGELSQSLDNSLSQVEDENRRRVFWCAFVLDKTLAAQFGRPPILRSSESDCPLPSIHSEDDEWMSWGKVGYHSTRPNVTPSSLALDGKKMGVSSYFINGCQLAVICEAIIEKYNVVTGNKQQQHQVGVHLHHQQGGNQVAELHGRLTRWMQATPDHLKWSPNEPNGHLPYVLHQQVWSQICMILIHRPYILKGSGDAKINSHAECSKATENVCDVFRDWERQYDLRAMPSGSVYCLFTAATIALANTTSTESQVAITAKNQLIQCFRWLKILSMTWSSATHHIAILQRLTAGIDPGSASEVVVSSKQGIDSKGLPYSPPHMSSTSSAKPEKVAIAANSAGPSWPPSDPSFLAPTSIQTNVRSSSSSSNNPSKTTDNQGPHRDEFGVDAFWNDMPLGEDFQRWDHFTQAYFESPNHASDDLHNNHTHNPTNTPSSNSNSNSNQAAGAYGMVPPPPPLPPSSLPISTSIPSTSTTTSANSLKRDNRKSSSFR